MCQYLPRYIEVIMSALATCKSIIFIGNEGNWLTILWAGKLVLELLLLVLLLDLGVDFFGCGY